jgi:heptosyltransferase-2
MGKRQNKPSHVLAYIAYRLAETALTVPPMWVCYRTGQFIGLICYYLLKRYRSLAENNVRIAFGKTKSEPEIKQLVKEHFITVGANFVCSAKLTTVSPKKLNNYIEYEGKELLQENAEKGIPIIYLVCHMGAWELLAQLESPANDVKQSTLYQALSNPYIDAHVLRKRKRTGLIAFDRKDGFNGPMAHLRTGGSLGILVDQNAGYRGVWCPLFGKLASTSNLAPLMAARSGATMFPYFVITVSPSKWKIIISEPLEVSPGETIEMTTARMNLEVEKMISRSPKDWFWVHNRWKTPKTRFLIEKYRRGFCLPPKIKIEDLQSFNILIIAPRSNDHCKISLQTVRIIARGRPDAKITILGNDSKVWENVPEIQKCIERPNLAKAHNGNAGPIGNQNFDVAILFDSSLEAALEAKRAGIPHIIGYSDNENSRFINHKISQEDSPDEPAYYNRIAESIGSRIP